MSKIIIYYLIKRLFNFTLTGLVMVVLNDFDTPYNKKEDINFGKHTCPTSMD